MQRYEKRSNEQILQLPFCFWWVLFPLSNSLWLMFAGICITAKRGCVVIHHIDTASLTLLPTLPYSLSVLSRSTWVLIKASGDVFHLQRTIILAIAFQPSPFSTLMTKTPFLIIAGSIVVVPTKSWFAISLPVSS